MVLDSLISYLFSEGMKEARRRERQRQAEAGRLQKRRQEARKLKGGVEEYDARSSLTELPGVGWKTAGKLYEAGFKSAEEAASASVTTLETIDGIGFKKAMKITRYQPTNVINVIAKPDGTLSISGSLPGGCRRCGGKMEEERRKDGRLYSTCTNCNYSRQLT